MSRSNEEVSDLDTSDEYTVGAGKETSRDDHGIRPDSDIEDITLDVARKHSTGAIHRIVSLSFSDNADTAMDALLGSNEELNTNANSVTEQIVDDNTLLNRLENAKLEDSNEPFSTEWLQKEKHYFIMSRSGKPVFSYLGDEEKLVTHMGLMTAIVSVVESMDDQLYYYEAEKHLCVFLVKEHVILVCISRSSDAPEQLLLQLNYLYNQIVSLLTLTTLNAVFKKPSYDLRNMLTDADRLLNSIIHLMNTEMGPLIGAVQCLPLPKSLRDQVSDAIAAGAKMKDLVFGVLLSGTRLVSLVHMKRQYLHPIDLYLLINLVSASSGFRLATHAWAPVCLPRFDAAGYLYAYIAHLTDAEPGLCLVLLSVDSSGFDALAEAKTRVLDKMQKTGCLANIQEYTEISHLKVEDCGTQELRHFVYKVRSAGQFVSPIMSAPFNNPECHQKVLSLYRRLHHLLHKHSRPLKLCYSSNNFATVMGWVTQEFELYAAFSPMVTKRQAINSLNRALKWLAHEKDRLFCLSSPTF